MANEFFADSLPISGGKSVAVSPVALPSNAYTKLGTAAGVQAVIRGRVYEALQGAGVYGVATNYGTVLCRNSSNRGFGTSSQTLYGIGDTVWISINPELPTDGIILCHAGDVESQRTELVKALSTYPQVAGIEFTKKTSKKNGKDVTEVQPRGLTSELLSEAKLLPRIALQQGDGVNGEWSQMNGFGGGLIVEPFRTILRGDGFCGVEAGSGDGLLRLLASNLEIQTLSHDSEDRVYGRMLVELDRGVFYPIDAILGNRPQSISISSPAVGGSLKHLSYRVKDNLPDKDPAKVVDSVGQYSLFSEYRGLDGSYRMTSASSITFEKWFGLRTPFERPAPLPEDDAGAVKTGKVSNFPGVITTDEEEAPSVEQVIPSGRLDGKPQPTESELNLAAERDSFVKAAADSVCSVLGLRGWMEKVINWQIKGGVTDLAGQFTQGRAPAYLTDFSDNGPTPAEDEKDENGNTTKKGASEEEKATAAAARTLTAEKLVDVYAQLSPAAWSVPRSICVNVGPYGQTKRVFLGRAIITITDEGGIVLEEAGGAKITLAGGCVQVEAPKDYSELIGRNKTGFIGANDASSVGGVSSRAVAGSSEMKVNGALSISGGLDGLSATTIYGGGTADNILSYTEDDNPIAGVCGGGLRILSAGNTVVGGLHTYVVGSTKLGVSGDNQLNASTNLGDGDVHIISGNSINLLTRVGRYDDGMVNRYTFADALTCGDANNNAFASIGKTSYLKNVVSETGAFGAIYSKLGSATGQAVFNDLAAKAFIGGSATAHPRAAASVDNILKVASSAFYNLTTEGLRIFEPGWVAARKAYYANFPADTVSKEAKDKQAAAEKAAKEDTAQQPLAERVPLGVAGITHPLATTIYPGKDEVYVTAEYVSSDTAPTISITVKTADVTKIPVGV